MHRHAGQASLGQVKLRKLISEGSERPEVFSPSPRLREAAVAANVALQVTLFFSEISKCD